MRDNWPLKTSLFSLVFLAGLLVATEAFALDGYQSRKHVFGGLGAGGGYGLVNEDGELLDEGPGMHLQGVVGGGVSDRLTLGVEVDWWSRSVDKGTGDQYVFHHGSVGGVGNFFIVGGLHLKGGAGFAYGICGGERNGRNCRWQELGLASEAGIGYEFWFNGTLAGSADLGYTHHFYSHSAFDTASLTFGLRWY